MSHFHAVRLATRVEASPVRRRGSWGLLSTNTPDKALFHSSKRTPGNGGGINTRYGTVNASSSKGSVPDSFCKDTLTVNSASPEFSCCSAKNKVDHCVRRRSLCETLLVSINGVGESGCSARPRIKNCSAHSRRKSFTATLPVQPINRDSSTPVRIHKFVNAKTGHIHHASSCDLLPSPETLAAAQFMNSSSSDNQGFVSSPCCYCSQVCIPSRRRSLGADVPLIYHAMTSWDQQISPSLVTNSKVVRSPKIGPNPEVEDLPTGICDDNMQEAAFMRSTTFSNKNNNSTNLSPHSCSYKVDADHLEWKMPLCAPRRGSGTGYQRHPMTSSLQSIMPGNFSHTLQHNSLECLSPLDFSEPPSQSTVEMQETLESTLQTVPESTNQPVILVSDYSNLTLEQEWCHSDCVSLSMNMSESQEPHKQSCSLQGLYSEEGSHSSQNPYVTQNSNSPQNLSIVLGPRSPLDTHLHGVLSPQSPSIAQQIPSLQGSHSQQRPPLSQGQQLHKKQSSQRLQLSKSPSLANGLLTPYELYKCASPTLSRKIPLLPQNVEKPLVLSSASYYRRRSSCIPCFTDFDGKVKTENEDKEFDSCSEDNGKVCFDNRHETSLEDEPSGPREQCKSPIVSSPRPFSEYSLLSQGFSSWLKATVCSSEMVDTLSQTTSAQPKEMSYVSTSPKPGLPGAAVQSPTEMHPLPTLFDIDPLVSSGSDYTQNRDSIHTINAVHYHTQSQPQSTRRSSFTSSLHWKFSSPTHSQVATSHPQSFPIIQVKSSSQNSITNSHTTLIHQDFPCTDPQFLSSQSPSSTTTHPQHTTTQSQPTAVPPQFTFTNPQSVTCQESIVISHSTTTFLKPTITFPQSPSTCSQFSTTPQQSKCNQQLVYSNQESTIHQESTSVSQQSMSPKSIPTHTQYSPTAFVQSIASSFPKSTYSTSKVSSIISPVSTVLMTPRTLSSTGTPYLQVTSPRFVSSKNMMGLDSPRRTGVFPHVGVFTSPSMNTTLQSPFDKVLCHKQSSLNNPRQLNPFPSTEVGSSFEVQNLFKNEVAFQGLEDISAGGSYDGPEVMEKNRTEKGSQEINLSSPNVNKMMRPVHVRRNSFARNTGPDQGRKWDISGKLLGRGGFGVVRLGYFNEHPVAVKTLRGPSATRSALRERRLLGLPSHPHLVEVLAVVTPTSITTPVMHNAQTPILHNFADGPTPVLQRTVCHANVFEFGEEEATQDIQVNVTYVDRDGIQQRVMSQSSLETTMGLSVNASPFRKIQGCEDMWDEPCQEEVGQINEKESRRFGKEGVLRQEAGLGDPWAWVVTELCTSQTLLSVINSPNAIYTTRDAIRWMGELSSGLAFLHQLGLVHRDVKPANALVLASGCVKLGDFGCCVRLHSDPEEGVTRQQAGIGRRYSSLSNEEEEDVLLDEENVLGTVPYQAPEVLRGQRGDDHSDVYSLGVTMWHLMTKEMPFNGLHPHVVIYKVTQHCYTPVDHYQSSVHYQGFSRLWQSSYESSPQQVKDHRKGGDSLLAALVHRLLLNCWTHPSVSRPSALQLCRILAALYLSPAT